MQYFVTISRLRWEHLTVPVEADSEEAAAAAVQVSHDAGEYDDDVDEDWDLGDLHEQEAGVPAEASPCYEAQASPCQAVPKP